MDQADADRLHITNRWLEYEGELRASLLRVLLIICFYAVELANYLSVEQVDAAVQQFHRQATYLSAAWLLVSLAALVAIGRRYLPSGLKYATSAVDVGLLTAVAWFGSGAASPLVSMYTLLVVMAGLRGSLRLIWFTTFLGLLAYFALLFLPPPGPLTNTELGSSTRSTVKPIAVMVMALAIGASGLLTGQLVRMLRQIVSEVAQLSGSEHPARNAEGSVAEVPT